MFTSTVDAQRTAPISPIVGGPMKTTVLPRLGIFAFAVAALALAACGSGGTSGTNVAASCTPAHKISTVKNGVLTVALTNTPPYSFQSGNEIAGIDSAIVNDLAKQECLSVEFAPYT